VYVYASWKALPKKIKRTITPSRNLSLLSKTPRQLADIKVIKYHPGELPVADAEELEDEGGEEDNNGVERVMTSAQMRAS